MKKKKMRITTIALVVIASMLFADGNAYAYSSSSFGQLSPYSQEYLKSINAGPKESLNSMQIQETLVALNEYYCEDSKLASTILEKYLYSIPSIISVEKDLKILAMHELMNLFDDFDSETKYSVYMFFKRYAQDSGDKESIDFFLLLKEQVRGGNLAKSESFKDNFIPSQAASWAYKSPVWRYH